MKTWKLWKLPMFRENSGDMECLWRSRCSCWRSCCRSLAPGSSCEWGAQLLCFACFFNIFFSNLFIFDFISVWCVLLSVRWLSKLSRLEKVLGSLWACHHSEYFQENPCSLRRRKGVALRALCRRGAWHVGLTTCWNLDLMFGARHWSDKSCNF